MSATGISTNPRETNHPTVVKGFPIWPWAALWHLPLTLPALLKKKEKNLLGNKLLERSLPGWKIANMSIAFTIHNCFSKRKEVKYIFFSFFSATPPIANLNAYCWILQYHHYVEVGLVSPISEPIDAEMKNSQIYLTAMAHGSYHSSIQRNPHSLPRLTNRGLFIAGSGYLALIMLLL